MIKLIQVTHKDELNAEVREMYESAFPEDERRDWPHLNGLIGNPACRIYLIFNGERIIGFISVWNLTEFRFIEHFTICSSERGKGFGSEVIRQIISEERPVVLEVEEPLSEMSIKRIRFYENLHFLVAHGVYFQPPYSKGKKMIKMLLMSYPNELLPANFESTTKIIHELVYKFQE
jgi:predicted acetyltransferase